MSSTASEVHAGEREPSQPGAPRVAAALARELEAAHWDYPWLIAPGLVAPTADPGARHAAATLEAMLTTSVRDALLTSDGEPSALVLNCGEGRLCHRLLEWGAVRVVGFESNGARLRRARLVRDHFGIPASALDLRESDSPDGLTTTELGTFDVVVLGGNVEPVELTAALIEVARECTRRLLAVTGVLPGREAVVGALEGAGFASVRTSPAPPDAERRFILGSHGVLLARPEAQSAR